MLSVCSCQSPRLCKEEAHRTFWAQWRLSKSRSLPLSYCFSTPSQSCQLTATICREEWLKTQQCPESVSLWQLCRAPGAGYRMGFLCSLFPQMLALASLSLLFFSQRATVIILAEWTAFKSYVGGNSQDYRLSGWITLLTVLPYMHTDTVGDKDNRDQLRTQILPKNKMSGHTVMLSELYFMCMYVSFSIMVKKKSGYWSWNILLSCNGLCSY